MSKDLLDGGDRYDNTPLHIASQKGYLSIVEVRNALVFPAKPDYAFSS